MRYLITSLKPMICCRYKVMYCGAVRFGAFIWKAIAVLRSRSKRYTEPISKRLKRYSAASRFLTGILV